MLAKTNILKKG